MKDLKFYIKESIDISEAIKDKPTTGDGSIDIINVIIKQLSEHPDFKGKDKELWTSAGQFVYDYMKELNNADREKIMNEFGLTKNSDFKDVHPADVSVGLSIYLNNIINKSN